MMCQEIPIANGDEMTEVEYNCPFCNTPQLTLFDNSVEKDVVHCFNCKKAVSMTRVGEEKIVITEE